LVSRTDPAPPQKISNRVAINLKPIDHNYKPNIVVMVDIDRDPKNDDEVQLFAKIREALVEPRPDYMDPNAFFIGSAGMEMMGCDIEWEKMPFTGTVDAEVIIFVE